jgi:hypothetical protein
LTRDKTRIIKMIVSNIVGTLEGRLNMPRMSHAEAEAQAVACGVTLKSSTPLFETELTRELERGVEGWKRIEQDTLYLSPGCSRLRRCRRLR